MAGEAGGTVKVQSLPPPRPKSPPEYPDLYGKRRELARVQLLEREIGFLEDELKFVEGLQPASRPCKEITDFVVANSDPFVPTTTKVHKSCGFWKWLCGSSCFSFSRRSCCRGCTPNLEMPNCCCDCNMPRCSWSCIRCCSIPKCRCCSCEDLQCCCKMPSCSLKCCVPECPSCSCSCSCSSCNCKGCISCYPKCPKLNLSSCCTKDSCCYSCYMCC